MSVRVLTGHCLDVLPTLKADSVQACITSPPYFQLRSYETEPQVWGGEPGCEHVWQHSAGYFKGGVGQNKTLNNAAGYREARDVEAQRVGAGAHCACGAWRGELGQEPTPESYISHLVDIFRAVRRVLRPDGVLMVNIADSMVGSGKGPSNSAIQRPASQIGPSTRNPAQFANGQAPTTWTPIPAGYKAKDLYGIPWMLAFALRADGWYLRGDYIWAKPAPMPESVRDRCTRSHEYVFHLTKQARYYWDADAIREDGRDWGPRDRSDSKHNTDGFRSAGQPPHRGLTNVAPGANRRSVWTISTAGYSSGDQDTDHYAVMPDELAETCIRATSSEKGCCAACGAPWQRVTEREPVNRTRRVGMGVDSLEGTAGRAGELATVTTGWQPTCAHEAGEPIPCTVLDPFAGAGTTVLAADRLGRHGVGIELNPAYADLATKRVYDDAPLLAAIEAAA